VAYAYGGAVPATAAINFPALTPARANGTVVPLRVPPDPAGWDLNVLATVGTGGTTHLLVDVTGYYED
jgi:hypothetical protein